MVSEEQRSLSPAAGKVQHFMDSNILSSPALSCRLLGRTSGKCVWGEEGSFALGQFVGADDGFDTADCVDIIRLRVVTPHVVQNNTSIRPIIEAHSVSYPNYTISLDSGKMLETDFGWIPKKRKYIMRYAKL